MAEQARVSSIDALESFRASLIVFLGRAHKSVDEVGDEVRRTRVWIQEEQRLHWERELRKRQRALDAAEQELLSAKLSGLRENLKLQQDAVRKAKAAVQEAEEKIRSTKIWTRDFSHVVDPLARRLESLRQYLDADLPRAIAFLTQAQKTLTEYAEGGAIKRPAPAAGDTPSASTSTRPMGAVLNPAP